MKSSSQLVADVLLGTLIRMVISASPPSNLWSSVTTYQNIFFPMHWNYVWKGLKLLCSVCEQQHYKDPGLVVWIPRNFFCWEEGLPALLLQAETPPLPSGVGALRNRQEWKNCTCTFQNILLLLHTPKHILTIDLKHQQSLAGSSFLLDLLVNHSQNPFGFWAVILIAAAILFGSKFFLYPQL